MLLAYIDEVGEPGAFVSPSHDRYRTSPAFGYAGFIIGENEARNFGARFDREKRTLFAAEVAAAAHPGRWERKGSSVFRPDTPEKYPEQLRVFDGLVNDLRRRGGHLFYHADEKPIGTPRQTRLDPAERERQAMHQTLNRIARHADRKDSNILVLIDQINEKSRAERLPLMYSHILGRATDFPEMARIVEPPMHIDSQLSAGIQFADWVAAFVGRAIDHQLVEDSRYGWISKPRCVPHARGAFTLESKLHLHQRAVADLNHSQILAPDRPLYPSLSGQRVGQSVHSDEVRKMRAAAERARTR